MWSPQLITLRVLGAWIRKRHRLDDWQLEFRQLVTLLSWVVNTGSWSSTADFYSMLVKLKSVDILGKSLDYDGNRLTNLFERTFKSGYLDNFLKALALLCYRRIFLD